MGYYNGKDILPKDLIIVIQEYFDGGYLYIPRKKSNKKSWGEVRGSKRELTKRNKEIYKKHLSGVSIKALADEYFLSNKTIYSIIAKMKRF